MEKRKILIVEDEVVTATDLKMSLEELRYIVTAIAPSGEKAIKKVEEDMPDLILMDILLKGEMDGVETAGIIHSRFDLPIIFLTAHSDESVLEKAKMTEPFGYIIKPYQVRELHSAIEVALYKHKMEIQRKELTEDLQKALDNVKLLTGLLPICSSCKDIRDDKGYWDQIENYIQDHSEALFSHGICPKCTKKLYPDLYEENEDGG